jgi:hypothetical protein
MKNNVTVLSQPSYSAYLAPTGGLLDRTWDPSQQIKSLLYPIPRNLIIYRSINLKTIIYWKHIMTLLKNKQHKSIYVFMYICMYAVCNVYLWARIHLTLTMGATRPIVLVKQYKSYVV